MAIGWLEHIRLNIVPQYRVLNRVYCGMKYFVRLVTGTSELSRALTRYGADASQLHGVVQTLVVSRQLAWQTSL